MEPPRQISRDEMIRAYYPELLLNDSLGYHLNVALRSIGSSVVADAGGGIHGDRRRRSGLTEAISERLFIASLSLGEIYVGSFSSSDLVEVARVTDAWCRGGPTGLDIPHFAEQFPEIRLLPQAYYFDDGPVVYTARAWEELLNRLRDKVPFLYPAAVLAFEQPHLAEMYPFTSHWRLRFSTLIGPPPTPFNMPIISMLGPDCFSVENRLYCGDILGKGTARDAVALVLANMPRGCGPARYEE